ncbi:AAA family ATPase [Amylocarpus encephaloides]|uniref:AAA family ATPase n=1 Tax=Amylocarpus encephaloides TaxID=45428 RepID=A0A9P7YBI5_9HELO|nr:AAA family ATPase [Amylocarpus encephaloides]
MDLQIAALEEKLAKLQHDHDVLSQKMATIDNASVNSDEKEVMMPVSRALILHNVPDEKSERRETLPDGTLLRPKVLENKNLYAFSLRKYFQLPFPADDEIDILGPELCELLRKNLSHYPGHTLMGENVMYEAPFEGITLNWDKLQKAADSSQDQAASDLKLLMKTIRENSSDRRLQQYFKNRSQNLEQKRITFENLWTIFPPGEKVFGRPFQKQNQVFIVQDSVRTWPIEESTRGKSKPWIVKCWTYDWNGEFFIRTLVTLKIDRFDGAKPINSLSFFPLRYHENPEQIEDELEARGRKFRSLCIAKKGDQMFHYKGPAIFSKKGLGQAEIMDYDSDHPLGEHQARKSRPKSVTSTVMVDFTSYNRYGPAVAMLGALAPLAEDPDCNCAECRTNVELIDVSRSKYDRATGEDNWDREQFILCSPRVLGYVLRDKQWAQLQVTIVSKESNANQDAYFEKLQLKGADAGKETKNLLMHLVQNNGGVRGPEDSEASHLDDIVVNKGKGLVILLYGPPGVGKTSTAETVAIAAKKPLFPVGVADVGTKAKYVESNLEKIFDLATTWEAILLIDEADVFLESRSKGAGNNTERNALVSVFLRVLEYYQGILFLTTNQIAQFDVAVQSRIHIALKYEALNEAQTTAIFMQFIRQLDAKKKVQSISKIETWMKSELIRRKTSFDGRQIRNIVSCAMSLAAAREGAEGKLTKYDLLKVVDIVREFKTEFQLQFDRYIRSQEGNEKL